MSVEIIDWGLVGYRLAFERQAALFEAALQQKAARLPVDNRLIFCEHPAVITLGRNGRADHLLCPEKLQAAGVELHRTDRGGDITFHGPGQIVGYPLLDLEAFGIGLKEYIHRIEAVIIQTLAVYGLAGERLSGATGVWLEPDRPRRARKVAAIGVRSSRYVTMHGFALNVHTDLRYFDWIHPCGFKDKGVTSLERELGRPVDTEGVKKELVHQFGRVFAAE